jgi:hypothetical protein
MISINDYMSPEVLRNQKYQIYIDMLAMTVLNHVNFVPPLLSSCSNNASGITPQANDDTPRPCINKNASYLYS